MPPTPLPERTFARKLASHTLVAAAGVALGSLFSFYHGQRSYAQEECVRRGMEARFEQDFPQYKDWQSNGPRPRNLGQVMASYSVGKVLYQDGWPSAPLELLEKAAEHGRVAVSVLERECAENSRRY